MAKKKTEQKSTPKPTLKSAKWLSRVRLYALIVFAFSCVVYCNTLLNGYNLDDELVTENHQVTSKGWDVLKLNFDAFNSVELNDSSFMQKLKYFMPVVFRVPYYQDKAGYKYEYRPIVLASFALEHALFAKNETVNGSIVETDSPFVSHLINVLLYALVCTLLFWALCILFKNYNIAFPFIISLLFVAYPMHTEVVASIKNRDELLALIFGLLSLRFSLAYIDRGKISTLVLVLLFFVLGLLSKPTTIVFALLIPLCVIAFINSSYLKLLLLGSVLVIPAIFFSRLYTIGQQFELGIMLYLIITGLYGIKNSASLWMRTKKYFSDSYKNFSGGKSVFNDESSQPDFNFLKNPLTAFAWMFIVLMPVVVSISGISIYNPWVACIPLLLLCILYTQVGDELKLILTTPILLVAIAALVKFFPQSKLIEAGIIIFLGCHIFSGRKSFRQIGLVNYLVYCVVSIVFLHSIQFIFLILFAGLLNRKYFYITWIAIALSLLLFLKRIFGLIHRNDSLPDMFVLLPVIYFFVFLLWKNRWRQSINSAALIIPMLLITYFTLTHLKPNNNAYYAAIQTYYRVNNIKAADPTPVQSIRPLNYPEYPLSYSDPFSLRFGTGMEVLGKYLQMAFIPYPMSYYYGYSCISPQYISEPIPLISLIVYIIMFLAAIYFFNQFPILGFSVFFYLISISVFSNLVMPIPGMIGDRFLLIPSIGFCVFITYLFASIFKQHFDDAKITIGNLKRPLQISLSIVLLLYSVLTFSRNTDWKDSLTLFRHDIKVVDNSAQAHNLLAVRLFLIASKEHDPAQQKQLLEEAVPHFKRALEIYHSFLNASYDLGRTYEALERNDQAEGRTAEALQRRDEALAQYQYTVKLDTTFVVPYFNMGTIMQNKGQYAEAIVMYQKFLTQYPRQIEAYTNLSFAYFQLHDYEKSIATNQAAIKATGEPLFPTINIAKTYMVMNKPDSALLYWQQAHTMKPNDAQINAAIEQLKTKQN